MDLQNQLNTTKTQLLKSLEYLEYSYKKVKSLPIDTVDYEQLETWESFMARFARTADLFISKYLRLKVLFEEPGFRGSLRDTLNQAEKFGIIEDVPAWIAIKEIRNTQAHEYSEEKLGPFFEAALKEAPRLLAVKGRI